MARQQETPHKSSSAEGSAAPAGPKNARVGEPATTKVQTSDPNIVAPEPAPPPDRAVSYQTSHLSGAAAAYPFDCGGGAEQSEPNTNGKQKHKHDQERHHHEGSEHREEHHSHPKHKKEKHPKEHHGQRAKLPRWPSLLLTGALALVCGVGGAWGYSALFGSGQTDHGKESGKGGKSGGEKSGDSNSDQDTSDHLKKEIQQLADNMDELGTRIDRLNQTAQETRMPVPQYYPGSSRIERMAPSSDGAAPIPTAFQTQLTVLQHKVDQMDDVPGRVQELERRVNELHEAIKILVEARAASGGAGQ